MRPFERSIDPSTDPRTELVRVFRAATRSMHRWQVTRAAGHLHDTESYLERMLDLAPQVAHPNRFDPDLLAGRTVARAFGVARRAMRHWHASGDPEYLGIAGQQLEVLLEAAPLETMASTLPELARDLVDQLRQLAPTNPNDLN